MNMAKPKSDQTLPSTALRAPFDGLSDEYQVFRKTQLNLSQQQQSERIRIHRFGDNAESAQTTDCLDQLCADFVNQGFAMYEWNKSAENPRQREVRLHAKLGLSQPDSGIISGDDNLSLLEDKTGTSFSRFVPYSNRQMNWHTDGYYNAQTEPVRCFTLYCIEQAASGGELTMMNNALLLIALYDENPNWVAALAHPEAVLFPANKDEEGHHRPDRKTAVFSMYDDGQLNTRFTTRTRNIQWRTPETELAAKTASKLIDNNPQWHTRVRLEKNQGLITANLLHKREAFIDEQTVGRRQILRGRYAHLPSTALHA
jgi:hypothetical protein